MLVERLNEALRKINPSITEEGREQAVKVVLRSESQKRIADNESFHKMFVDGIDIQIQTEEGEIYKKVWLYDFDNPENNDFLAANQFTVIENNIKRRLDVIIFVNGIPLLVIELKNLAEEDTTVWTAFDQFQTYKQQFPSLFRYNEILVISDGVHEGPGR